MDLTNAHVVVTGASRGIGAAIARELHARGAHVTLVARSAEALAELAAQIEGHALPADLSDPAELGTVVARAEELGGPVDVLVNNAGIDESGLFWAQEAAAIRRLIDVNVTAPMELARQVLPGMIERGRGHIVNVSSVASLGVFPGMVAYSTSKSALTHFSAGLRADLKGLPIGVTNVQPGFVEPTDMADNIMKYGPAKAARRRFGRLGLLTDTDCDKLARAIVSAIVSDRRHVLRPARAFGFAKSAELPRRLTEIILSGVSPRP